MTHTGNIHNLPHLSWTWMAQEAGCLGSADSKEGQNFPASLGGLGDENWRIPLGFPVTAVDILIQGPLQPSPNHPRTARGLFRQKRTVLIPHVRRELEHLDEDRRCSPVRPHARLPGLHKCSAGHIRDTVDSCSYKTGPGGWH